MKPEEKKELLRKFGRAYGKIKIDPANKKLNIEPSLWDRIVSAFMWGK